MIKLTREKIWEIWHSSPKDGAATVSEFARAIEAEVLRINGVDDANKMAYGSNSQEIERALEHEYTHLNCPHCGGSGHVDDAKEKLRGKDGKVHPTIQCMIDDMNGGIEG